MKLVQILRFLTLIVEKITFWKQTQNKEPNEEEKQTSTTAVTNKETFNRLACSAPKNLEASASPTKKASLGTKKREGTHEK